MSMVAGLVLSIVFQMAHTVEAASFPEADEISHMMPDQFALHQLRTTANFATHSKWISWYVGGLNFQVEHHLFPSISHVHYPALAHITKATAEEFGVTYLENETLMQALKSHVATLQRFGKLPDINEALA